MKLRHFLFCISAAAALFAGCDNKERLTGEPSLTLSPSELTFESAAETKSITVSATRDWEVKGTLPEWLDVNPLSGGAEPDGRTVEVTVTGNTGTDRNASVEFTIGTITRTLTISQKGEGGAPVGGNGTLESPYSVAEALAVIEGLGADVESQEVYLKGLVSSFKGDVAADITKYGSISYYISDDGTESGTLLVYAGKYFNGEKFTSADQLKVKDEVVILGKLINYKGNTPEVTMGNKIVSLNGQGGGDTPDPGEFTVTPISTILGLSEGTSIGEGIGIEGVIVSNADLNNLTSKKGAYIQDATGAIQIRFSSDHSFKFGDKVKINLSGSKKGAYNKAVQVEVSNSSAALVSSGENVQPKTVSMADFLANKYEGQYVALENVQVVADDLSKTFVVGDAHTSINFEDKSGSKFLVFSSKYSTFGSESVPQGAGTLKGIATRNNDDIQLIFAQKSDYAGLTGDRFGNGKAFSVSPTSINVAASAESATFKVSGNVSWTASVTEGSDWVEILYGESGNGADDVVLSLTKNESEESARTAKITVSTTEDAAVKTYEVVITQAKKAAAGDMIVDVLNRALTGIENTVYADWSGKTATSPAVYAGQSAGGNDSIQLRSKQNNSGIITTTSGGKVRKVVVTWQSATSSAGDRKLNIYGKSTPYASTKDLYAINDEATSGTLLGSIVCGTSTELTIDGDYEFIGMRSSNGAMYLSEIKIYWE